MIEDIITMLWIVCPVLFGIAILIFIFSFLPGKWPFTPDLTLKRQETNKEGNNIREEDVNHENL